MMSHFCLVALKILSLSLTFDNLLITCHGMDSLGSPFCNVLWLLESEYLLPFPDMGLSPIISSNKISPLSFFPFRDSHSAYTHLLVGIP